MCSSDLDEPRGRLYVSLWAQAAVAVIDTRAWKTIGRIEVEEHPNEMLLSPDGRRLFVANANRNSVSVIDLSEEVSQERTAAKVTETLVATLTPDLDRLVAFYREAFGAEVTFEMAARPDHPRMIILDLGGGAALNVFEVAPDEIIEIGRAHV